MAIAADNSSDLFIDGKLVPGGSGRYPTINPATEEVLGTAADGDAADMERAIGAARRAFDTTDWSTDTELRVRCIRQLRDAMKANIEELRELTIAEVGAPPDADRDGSTRGPVDDLSFSADTAETYEWRQDLGVASPMGIKTRRTIAREAVGVVGAITPWNFPAPDQPGQARARPGGRKHHRPQTGTRHPWCAAVLGELIAEHTDIPPGVVNIVTSNDHAVGALLSSDPRVDMVSFTGSTNTGRAVMAAGATTIKKVFLELGGKSAFPGARRRRPGRRVLDVGVHRLDARRAGLRDHHPAGGAADRYDEAVEAAAATMGGIKPGDRPTPEPSAARSFPSVSATGCSPISTWRSTRAAGSPAVAAVRPTGTGVSSSSPR